MKFKELREATLFKTQIKKVHDKADDLPKNDFIKRYGKDGDSVRFATATKMVKKELGIEDYEEGFKSDAQRKAAFASGYKEKGKKKDEALDDNDKETIKPIIKQLQKSVKAHDKQAKQLQKDIQDEVELTEGRVMIAVDKKTRKKWQFSDGMIVKHNGKQYKTEGVTTQQVLELTASFGTLKLGKKDIEAGFAKGIFSVVDDGSVYQPWKNDFEPEGEKELTEVHFSNRNEPPAAKGMHKLRSGRDIPSTPQVDKIHKKVVAMTDRNDHSGARIEIAKACGDKQLVQIFSTLELIHDKYSGAVGNQSIELRGKMMNPLNKAIERKFGKYADVIQDAL